MPESLLNTADMVGYAICHRISSHSLLLNERPLPLCARCTGTFLGGMIALTALGLTKGRVGGLPPIPILLTLLGFTALMAVDGLNSYLDLIRIGAPLYRPNNPIRLLTGTLNGLMLGSVLYPLTISTLCKDYLDEPSLGSFKELGVLVLVALGIASLALTGWAAVLLPLALVSAVGVLALLTLVNAVIFAILTRRENRAEGLHDLALPLIAGLVMSLVMVAIIDVVRFALTGTMAGLPGLPF